MLLLGEIVRVEEATNRTPSGDECRGFAEDESDDFEENNADIDSLGLEAREAVSWDRLRMTTMRILEDLCNDLES